MRPPALRIETVIPALRLRDRLPAPDAVALTFDDGPDPVYTPEILDVLARLGATATFFLVGRKARRHPELVRRIVAAGHAVGSHTMSHRDAWTLPMPALVRDQHGGRRVLEDVTGRTVLAFRPPKGYVDRRTRVAMWIAGLRPWLWTIDTEDWLPSASAESIVTAVSGLAAGDVVLLHDGIEQPVTPAARDRSSTVAAVPGIVALARSRGLEPRLLGT